MVKKEGNFPYNISDFEKKADKYFPNEDIVVGAMDGVDEEIIQAFFSNVMDYEMAHIDEHERK